MPLISCQRALNLPLQFIVFVIFSIVFAADWKRMFALLISIRLRGIRMQQNRLTCGHASEFIVHLLVHLNYIWEGELVCNLG